MIRKQIATHVLQKPGISNVLLMCREKFPDLQLLAKQHIKCDKQVNNDIWFLEFTLLNSSVNVPHAKRLKSITQGSHN